jgi:hypothetical protein
MRLFATFTLIAAALFWSHPLYAVDLAQGHHLWEVRAPNGTRSYIAASGAPTDDRGVSLLKRQTGAAASVRRVAVFNHHHDLTIRSGEWSRRAYEVLSEDLLIALETELNPSLQAIFGAKAGSVRHLKLEGIRILLCSSPSQFYAKGHSPIEKIITAFQRERDGVLTLKPMTSGELLDLFGKARAEDGRSPTEIIGAVFKDRLANGPIGDRSANAFLAGDWQKLRALAPTEWLAVLGFEHEALHDLQFRSTNALVDMIFPALSDMPTLVMIPGGELAREPHLFTVLQQRGFKIRPVPLSDAAPTTGTVNERG